MEGNEGSHENDGSIVEKCARPGNVGMEYTTNQDDADRPRVRKASREKT